VHGMGQDDECRRNTHHRKQLPAQQGGVPLHPRVVRPRRLGTVPPALPQVRGPHGLQGGVCDPPPPARDLLLRRAHLFRDHGAPQGSPADALPCHGGGRRQGAVRPEGGRSARRGLARGVRLRPQGNRELRRLHLSGGHQRGPAQSRKRGRRSRQRGQHAGGNAAREGGEAPCDHLPVRRGGRGPADEDRHRLVQRPFHRAHQLPAEIHHHPGHHRRFHHEKARVLERVPGAAHPSHPERGGGGG